MTQFVELTSSTNSSERALTEVADYIVTKLGLAGVAAVTRKARACQDEVAVEVVVNIATGNTLTLWLIQHRSGTFNGLIEVLAYSDPFEAECLIEVGPCVIGKILRDCGALAA